MRAFPYRRLRRAGISSTIVALGVLVLAGLGFTTAGVVWPTRSIASAADGTADTMNMGHAATGASYWKAVAGTNGAGTGITRTYFISADEVVWDYTPTHHNGITGEPFDATADTYVRSGPGRIGSRYAKCLYRGYTDGSFDQRTVRSADEAYLGMLGPIIRAEVGDTIKVVVRNACPFPTSVHPHGVFYGKGSEGAPYDDGTGNKLKLDDAVAHGRRHTYVWKVPERAGPGPGDGSSVMWMYHSHTDEVADTYAGLIGPMEITRKGDARPDGSPKDVNKEFFVLYAVMNENESPLLKTNLSRFASRPLPPHLDEDEEFGESNLMHSINGYVFGNQPMMTMKKGDHVRWYVMSMGTEVDLHTPHWHGNDAVVNGMRMDVVSLLPGTMVVADMVPDDVGTWLFHCHVNDHIHAGMLTRYRVLP